MVCVRHYVKLTGVVLSQEEPPTLSWESSQVPAPALLPGAVLAWLRLGFSAEHQWCSAGHGDCIWGDQEVQRAVVLPRAAVLTLLLCSAKSEELPAAYVAPSQCCGPVNGTARHSDLRTEDDSSVKAVAFCMQLFAAEHLVVPALACGASGCSWFASLQTRLYFAVQKGLVLLLCVCTSLMAPKAQCLL